jgi:hypothetical protein
VRLKKSRPATLQGHGRRITDVYFSNGGVFSITNQMRDGALVVLAVMLGVHRPTVSVVLRTLHHAGLISSRYGRILILKRARSSVMRMLRGHPGAFRAAPTVMHRGAQRRCVFAPET